MQKIETLSVIAVIAALVGTAVLLILVLPQGRRRFLSPPLRAIADFFNLRRLMLEGILKAVYVFLTLLVIIGGIFAMFVLPQGVAIGLVMILLGPCLLRLIHEMIMLRLVTLTTLQEIRDHLKGGTPAQEEERAPARRERAPRRQGRASQDGGRRGYAQAGDRQAAEGDRNGQPVWTAQVPQAYPPQQPGTYAPYGQQDPGQWQQVPRSWGYADPAPGQDWESGTRR